MLTVFSPFLFRFLSGGSRLADFKSKLGIIPHIVLFYVFMPSAADMFPVVLFFAGLTDCYGRRQTVLRQQKTGRRLKA